MFIKNTIFLKKLAKYEYCGQICPPWTDRNLPILKEYNNWAGIACKIWYWDQQIPRNAETIFAISQQFQVGFSWYKE